MSEKRKVQMSDEDLQNVTGGYQGNYTNWKGPVKVSYNGGKWSLHTKMARGFVGAGVDGTQGNIFISFDDYEDTTKTKFIS